MSATIVPTAPTPTEILDAGLSLQPDDRAMVAHMLLDSLAEPFDEPDDVKQAWREEIVRRLAEYQAGRMTAFSKEEFFAQIRQRRAAR